MKNPKIDILMATYNGEKYLKDQIESILHQTYGNWKLIIGDDNSSDNTTKILKKYKQKYQEKIELIINKKNIGIVKNFNSLLQKTSGDYIMFSDQDDIWLPEKIELTLRYMTMTEMKNKGKPILVHTDLTVVDDNMNVLGPSFYKYQKINPYITSLNRLLVQNNVTGCTIMMNSQLKKISIPFPDRIVMHDWYLSLLASKNGIISYIPERTILYRQHDQNKIGASKYDLLYIVRKFLAVLSSRNSENLKRCMEQAGELQGNESASLFSHLYDYNYFLRRYYMLKFGFFKYGILKNIGLFLAI